MSTLAVIGSRGMPDDVVEYFLEDAGGLHDVTILVSGGAKGVDQCAERLARARGLTVVSYRPRKQLRGYIVHKYVNDFDHGPVVGTNGEALTYPTFGHAAKARNWWIVRDGDRVKAFWDGVSSGTAHGIAAAARFLRPLAIHMEGDS